MQNFVTQIQVWLQADGMSARLAVILAWTAVVVGIALLAFLANLLSKRVIVVALERLAIKSKTTWDDVLVERHVFTKLSRLAPALVVYAFAPTLPQIQALVQRLCLVYMVIAGLAVMFAFLNAVHDIYETLPIAHRRPIKGFIDIAKVISTIVLGVISIAILLDRSPWLLISGFGAITAILALVFKDAILGMTASVQLSANDMVTVGDWITMPKYGADGDVVDVNLSTIKVQNFDKTIVTIPAHALIYDSFTNWRGMAESGGRRIKRAIHIDVTSIRFCTDDRLEHYAKYRLLEKYVADKQAEIEEFAAAHDIDNSDLINGLHATNIGVFRAYLLAYLRQNPNLRQDMTFLVRQLEPTAEGLPLQIYVFSKKQQWAEYEAILADIFDHILAAVPHFGLRLHRNVQPYPVHLSDRDARPVLGDPVLDAPLPLPTETRRALAPDAQRPSTTTTATTRPRD